MAMTVPGVHTPGEGRRDSPTEEEDKRREDEDENLTDDLACLEDLGRKLQQDVHRLRGCLLTTTRYLSSYASSRLPLSSLQSQEPSHALFVDKKKSKKRRRCEEILELKREENLLISLAQGTAQDLYHVEKSTQDLLLSAAALVEEEQKGDGGESEGKAKEKEKTQEREDSLFSQANPRQIEEHDACTLLINRMCYRKERSFSSSSSSSSSAKPTADEEEEEDVELYDGEEDPAEQEEEEDPGRLAKEEDGEREREQEIEEEEREILEELRKKVKKEGFQRPRLVSMKCPLSHESFKSPVSTRFAPSGRSCIHVFEKESILAQLDRLASSSYGRGRGGQESIPCPFVGCRSTICRQDLERDLETLVHLRQEKIRHAQEALNKLPAVHTPSAA